MTVTFWMLDLALPVTCRRLLDGVRALIHGSGGVASPGQLNYFSPLPPNT